MANGTGETWPAEMEGAVEQLGLGKAWEKHFPDIVRAHERGQSLRGRDLYGLLSKSPELKAHFEKLSSEVTEVLEGSGRNAETVAEDAAGASSHSGFVAGTRKALSDLAEDFAEILEGDGSPMKCLSNETFQNWGYTVKNVPRLTCLPKTKKGVCNVVKWARAHGKTVRVSGYRHTWSDLYSNDGEVLISLLPLDVVEDLPAREPPIDPDDQLQGIEIVGETQQDGVTKALCRIGAATTNEQFRRWCLNEKGGDWKWTVPMNVIMVEITWGGSNAPICHGAGWRNKTLSDIVTELEFVNAKGELQVVNDPDQLKAAAGCFGLLGVVTAVTLVLDPMTYAVMKPVKERVALTIPPPEGMTVPSGVDMSGITQADLDKAWEDFVSRCENDYYAEWFWFTKQSRCWTNTWKNDGDRKDARDYPGELDSLIQAGEEYLAQLSNDSVFKLVSGEWQARLLGDGAMWALPDDETIVTPLIDGLHFRRGIQNMRVLDMELEIPIPPRADDARKPDWTVCQRAWWDVIANVYERADTPMRLTLEMRIMADSNITMAPQYGNSFGTCSIEVLTPLNVDEKEWLAFMQDIATLWDSYRDPDGNPLNVRPHWAKQWQGLKFRGMAVVDYLKQVAYKDRFPEFKTGLTMVAQAGGYTLADLQKRFSNPLLDEIFADVFA